MLFWLLRHAPRRTLKVTSPMIPYIPETVDQARARFSAAIEPLFDLEDPQCPSAGASRTHVFDFEDGLRLVISRDFHPDTGVQIHLSASVNTAVVKSVGIEFLFKAECRFREIADWPDAPLSLLGLSPEKRIPHWIIPESAFRHRCADPLLSRP